MSDIITIPVLIVGGGGAGLTASMLLSSYGIDSLLVSKYPSTSHLPKAHLLNQKTMEILRELGLAETIYAHATPQDGFRYISWRAGFAGPHEEFGREFARIECWGHGYTNPNWMNASPCASANFPQMRLEPILKAHAETMGPGRVCFNHNFLSLEQDDTGVTALIEDRNDGHQYTVRARYLLGCDGGRAVGKQVGVEMEGMRNLATSVSIHMSADLSPWVRDPEVVIDVIASPDFGGAMSGLLVPMGPDHWGPHSEEWVLHLGFLPGDEQAFDDDAVLQRMRMVLGLPDFDPQIHLMSRWSMEGILASHLRINNVFLLGDAAHRHPPTGGLGLNTAIQDTYNLCWKIAAVLNGHASDDLLDTYEQERKPIGARAVQRSLENLQNDAVNSMVPGLSPLNTPEANWECIRRLWSDEPETEALRLQFERMMSTLSMEFNELNVEYGYTYTSSAIIPDDTPAPPFINHVQIYEPSTRPGSTVPHAWITRLGKQKALIDLAGHGHFLLIAGEEGEAWCQAATQLAQEQGLPLQAIRIGPFDGDWLDLRFDWMRQREISPGGAILVRPDHFIAWRSLGASENPRATLETVLDQVFHARQSHTLSGQ